MSMSTLALIWAVSTLLWRGGTLVRCGRMLCTICRGWPICRWHRTPTRWSLTLTLTLALPLTLALVLVRYRGGVRARSRGLPGLCTWRLCLLSSIWKVRCIFHIEDSLLIRRCIIKMLEISSQPKEMSASYLDEIGDRPSFVQCQACCGPRSLASGLCFI